MQNLVKEFMDDYQLHTDAQTRFVDLVSEVGELGKEILLATDYGKQNYAPSPALSGEVGDCLFSLLALCCQTGIDAQQALEQALSKYRTRFAQKGGIGS